MGATDSLYQEKLEVTLDGRQLFYLFFGGSLVAAFVFVLGVTVGRRVEARSHGFGPPTSDPLEQLDRIAQRGNTFTFRTALSRRSETPELQAQIAEKQAAANGTNTKVAAVAQLPGVPSNENGAAVREHATASSMATPPTATSRPGASDVVNAAPAKVAVPKTSDPSAAKVVAPVAKAPAEVSVLAKPSAGTGRFVLQITASLDKAQAESIRTELKAKGVEVALTQVEVEGEGVYHRVRATGTYATYEEAVAAKTQFEAKTGKIAYVRRQ